MKYPLYERPREKLRNKGAENLTYIELLQLVIGSGISSVSGAMLAREVQVLILTHEVIRLPELLAIKGMGEAKACQILAVFELVRRGVP